MENKHEPTTFDELSELSELTVVEGMMEAQIIKARLDNFGIPCMLKFEAIGRVIGITTDGLGKVQVMVPPDYLDKAEEVMESAYPIKDDESAEDIAVS